MEISKRSRQQFEVQGSDSDEDEAPRQKKPRFPKGKKQKPVGDELGSLGNGSVDGPIKGTDPRLAAKQRASRRRDLAEELLNAQAQDTSVLDDIGAAEEEYENDEDLEDDGIKIEPFNLRQERQEGYFDSEGNYVEYGNGNEIKDAWLDSVEVDTRFADDHLLQLIQERDDGEDLPSDEIGRIKRRIANVLQPGETVLQALRRMKGTSNNKSKREKMPAETKVIFDQLTDDAMKLMDDGDYNVYEEKKETFEREAEGYERLVCSKGGTLVGHIALESNIGVSTGQTEDIFADEEEARRSYTSAAVSLPISENVSDMIDIFGEDDATANVDMFSDDHASISQPPVQESAQFGCAVDESTLASSTGIGGVSSDYIYDESSGYYYSSRLGYYYDPSTGLFCSATSGKWYKFNEQSNMYEEMQNESTEVTNH